MADKISYSLTPIGFVRSTLKSRHNAPRQGSEGAPEAWLEITSKVARAAREIEVGDEVILITWFHKAKRSVLKVAIDGTPVVDIKPVLRGDR